ncbi:acyl carrier protein, partial [Helicobacter muridarum]
MQDIIEVLRFKLIDLLDIESLQDTQSLLDSNEWDSLSKIAIIAFVEKRYQVSLSINELDKTNSLQDIAKLIVKHIDTNNTTKQ